MLANKNHANTESFHKAYDWPIMLTLKYTICINSRWRKRECWMHANSLLTGGKWDRSIISDNNSKVWGISPGFLPTRLLNPPLRGSSTHFSKTRVLMSPVRNISLKESLKLSASRWFYPFLPRSHVRISNNGNTSVLIDRKLHANHSH